MSKKLTPEYIRLRTKCEKLEGIRNLNLWGCDLEDVSIIRDLPNLEVVSLSINKIKTLRDFANLKYLRELYIRKNMVSDLSDVNFLKKCANLRTLWLNENPLAENKNYRAYVIKTLPQIVKLDDVPITNEERNNLNGENFDEIEINDNEDEKYEQQSNDEEYKFEKYEKKSTPTGNNSNNYQKPSYSNPYEDRPVGANNRQIHRQNTDNLYSAKRPEKVEKVEKKQTPSPNTRSSYDNNDYEIERKRYRPERDEPVKKTPERNYENNNNYNEKKVKNETVVNCVLMLVNELGLDDIERIRRELDKISRNLKKENY